MSAKGKEGSALPRRNTTPAAPFLHVLQTKRSGEEEEEEKKRSKVNVTN